MTLACEQIQSTHSNSERQTRNAVESAIDLAKGCLGGTWEQNARKHVRSIEKWTFLICDENGSEVVSKSGHLSHW